MRHTAPRLLASSDALPTSSRPGTIQHALHHVSLFNHPLGAVAFTAPPHRCCAIYLILCRCINLRHTYIPLQPLPPVFRTVSLHCRLAHTRAACRLYPRNPDHNVSRSSFLVCRVSLQVLRPRCRPRIAPSQDIETPLSSTPRGMLCVCQVEAAILRAYGELTRFVLLYSHTDCLLLLVSAARKSPSSERRHVSTSFSTRHPLPSTSMCVSTHSIILHRSLSLSR